MVNFNRDYILLLMMILMASRALEHSNCSINMLWINTSLPIPFRKFFSPWLTLIFFNAAAAKSLQLCPTLCDPIDGSPSGSHVPGILQARILEWVAISLSNAWKWKMKVKSFSRVRLLVTPRTAAYQALPSKDFSRQEYWSGVPLQDQCIYLSFFLKFIYFNWRLITL